MKTAILLTFAAVVAVTAVTISVNAMSTAAAQFTANFEARAE